MKWIRGKQYSQRYQARERHHFGRQFADIKQLGKQLAHQGNGRQMSFALN